MISDIHCDIMTRKGSNMNKFKELTDKYIEQKGQDLSQEKWELIEKMNKEKPTMNDKEAIKLFESLFCEISELEEE